MLRPLAWRYWSISWTLERMLGSTYSHSTSKLGPICVSMSMTLYPFCMGKPP